MGLIAKLLGAASKEDMQGICLGSVRAWSVSGIRDAASFLRALPELLPENSALYLEGTSAPEVIEFIQARQPPASTKIALGMLWPKPTCHHMRVTRENLFGLADIVEKHAEPEVCSSLHVYRDERILLEWHDAFDLPLRISPDIEEQKIQKFCSLLGRTYAKEPETLA